MDLDYLKDVGLRIFRVLGLVGLTEKNFNSLYAPGKAYRNFKFLQGTPITVPDQYRSVLWGVKIRLHNRVP